MLWTGDSDKFAVWENEFFNRSVGTIYTTSAAVPGGLAQTPVTVDREGFFHDADGNPISVAYLLTDSSGEIDGDVYAQDKRKGLRLYGVGGPLRQLSFVDGLYPQDTWSERNVTYTRHDCQGGTLAVELQSDPALFIEPNVVTARVGERAVGRAVVGPLDKKVLTVPLESDGDTCIVRFAVAKTAVPAEITNGANPDPRSLGIHFNRFTYRP